MQEKQSYFKSISMLHMDQMFYSDIPRISLCYADLTLTLEHIGLGKSKSQNSLTRINSSSISGSQTPT